MIAPLFGWLLPAVVVAAFVRTVPLTGRRRHALVGLRLAALACVAVSLHGGSCRRRVQEPRHVAYLVDVSESMDAGKLAWAARRVASLEALRPRQATRSVIAFADDAQTIVPAGHVPLTDPEAIASRLSSASVARQTTNLEAGLLAGLAELSDRSHGRVILISDGRQTVGNAERILSHLRREGLEVYPVAVPPADSPQVSWEDCVVPPVVRQGASIPAKLVMTNGTDRAQPIDVTVDVGGVPIVQRRVVLKPGWQVVPVAVPTLKTGSMPFEISIAPAGRAASQRKSAVVEVEGPPRVLWVQERASALPQLAIALKRRQFELSVIPPSELPAEAGQLLDYDAVLLFQTPKSSFSAPQVDALRQYAERLGGGVVMVGLGGELDRELNQDAPLDALLPVRFEPKGLQESKRRICVVMLIDRSASMIGPRIAATKRAAVELVNQLSPEDLVGVLAFDTVPYVVVELQPVRQVTQSLIEKLVHLKSTGGTDILPALQAGAVRLAASGATVKHLLLLSDGNTPIDGPAYTRLMAEFREQRVTVSTIGIGPAFVNTEFLKWVAAGTGGTFYALRSLDELPQLIARDTDRTTGDLPFTEGTFTPRRAATAEWFSEVDGWPFLKGYLTVTAKPGARVELEFVGTAHAAGSVTAGERVSPVPDPLLAVWRVGLGHVAVFASDADRRWSPEWIQWEQFDGVWAELLRHTMRPRPTEELFVWLDQQGAQPQLIIDGDLQQPTADRGGTVPAADRAGPVIAGGGASSAAGPTAELLSSDGAVTTPLALVQQGAFRWRAAVGQLDPGWYQLIVHPGGESALAARWVKLGAFDARVEQPRLAADEALLRRLAQATGGEAEAPDRAFLPPVEWTDASVPWLVWLLPLALVLMLADVALRGKTML